MQKFKQIREATATSPYAIGMAAAKKKYGYGTGAAEDLPKKVITKAHEIAKKIKANESFDDVLYAMDLDIAFAQLSEEDQQELLNSPEFDQLDEVSKATLGSYVKKAKRSADGYEADAAYTRNWDKQQSRASMAKANSRRAGVTKALGKLAGAK